jgi:chromosome partitioning protein
MAAARAADLILIPCRPGVLDLRAIGTTEELCRIAGKPAFVVLNAMPPLGSRIVDDAREAVAVHGIEVAPVTIGQRAAYAHALTVGLTAPEYEQQGKTADEIAALMKWLLHELLAR